MDRQAPQTRHDATASGPPPNVGGPSFEARLAEHSASILILAELRMSPALKRWISPEDLAQDVMLAALAAKSCFDASRAASLKPWLAGIAERKIGAARHEMYSRPRPLRIQSPDSASASGVIEAELPGSITTPSFAAVRHENHRRLLAALESLPDSYREVVVLRQLHGLKLVDVASRMRRRPTAAAMLLRRALIRLRTLFHEQSDAGPIPSRCSGTLRSAGNAAATRTVSQDADGSRKYRRPDTPVREAVG